LVDNIRKAKSEGGFYVPAEAKLILVIRIRGYYVIQIKYQHSEPTGQTDTKTPQIETSPQCCTR